MPYIRQVARISTNNNRDFMVPVYMTDTGIAISLFKTKNRYIERFPLNIDYVELIDRKYLKGWVAGSWTKNNDVVSVDLTRLRINLT